MYTIYENFLEHSLQGIGIGALYITPLSSVITLILVAIVCWAADFITRRIFLSLVAQFAKKSKTVLDDILVEKRLFHRLAQLAPTFVIYSLAPVALYEYPSGIYWVQVIAKSLMILVAVRVFDAFMNSLHTMYELLPDAKQKPIKGYIQVLKIIAYFIASLLILSVVFDKSLVYFFSGLGALAAVLMLVFKDSILGLVAGIQLSSNNMLKPGDWITFNKYGADGHVIEISLQTVKIQNFDKTIVTIPTYSLIAESFQNWRGMEESEGRRFKRSLIIDPRSVTFASQELLETLQKQELTKSFIEKEKGIENTASNNLGTTNLGIFRYYIEYLIKNSVNINTNLSLLVKHGTLSEHGLVIDIICFTKEKAGVAHERIQAELIEHLIASSRSFGLHIYIHPSGNDVKSLV